MDEELKPGDVVYLKSGSQRMTVEAVYGNDDVHVVSMPYGAKEITKAIISRHALVKRAATR